jgi:DNA-directed RNA polymerase specialized sigma24 family protein
MPDDPCGDDEVLSREAFASFYDRMAPRLLVLLLSWSRGTGLILVDVEDVLQDTFVRLWCRLLRAGHPIRRPREYACVVALRCLKKRIRQVVRERRALAESAAFPQAAHSSAAEAAEEQEVAAATEERLRQLRQFHERLLPCLNELLGILNEMSRMQHLWARLSNNLRVDRPSRGRPPIAVQAHRILQGMPEQILLVIKFLQGH